MTPEDLLKVRLPLYGPLEIEDPRRFLKEAKTQFNNIYESNFSLQVNVGDYKLLRVIGRGNFGMVVLVKDRVLEESSYAMKVLSKRQLVRNKIVDKALNEKKVLQALNWPVCIRLEYFSQDYSHIYFFLPFISGGELFSYLRRVERFTEDVSRFYAAQVVLGFEYLHHLDIIFRDLKPENLLLDHLGFIKITDFGFAKIVSKRTYTFCGTPDFISPEVIMGVGYGKAVDWWALGVLIFEMNSGRCPFNADDPIQVYSKVMKGHYEVPKHFSNNLRDIVKRLIQINLTRRIGTLKGGVGEVKNHTWFKDINWQKLLNRRVDPPFVPDNNNESSDESPNKKSLELNISKDDTFKTFFENF